MKIDILQFVVLLAAVALLIYLCYYLQYLENKKEEYSFSPKDKRLAEYALIMFYNIDSRKVQDVTDHELKSCENDVILAAFPETKSGQEEEKGSRENFNSFNTRFWPHYYYSFPYNYKYGTPWPPGLFSRMYYWSPGFHSGSGWMFYLRPGNDYFPDRWPRNRWIRNNGNYYYVSNRGDYAKKAADYSHIHTSNWQ